MKKLFAASLFFATATATAVPIMGTVSLGGGYTPLDASGNQTTLDLATAVDFDPAGAGGSLLVMQAGTDDLSSLTFGTAGTITDFVF